MNLFLWIFRDFMGFNRIIKIKFFNPYLTLPGSAGRPERSTGRAQECAPCQLAGRPSGRPTEGNSFSGCLGRPGGRPAREPLLSGSGPDRPGG